MAPGPKKNSLICLRKDDDDQWYFVSVKGDGTLRLRVIPRPARTPDLDGVTWESVLSDYTLAASFSREDIAEKLNLPKAEVAWKNFGTLVSIVARLDSEQAVKVIPITEMRKCYEWLKDRPEGMNKLRLHAALAGWFATKPHLLTEVFLKSREAFSEYSNPDEAFTPRNDPLEIDTDEKLKATDRLVNTLVQTHKGNIEARFEGLDLGARTVAREIGPMRSTGKTGPWCFEDGRPIQNSGAGGLDLLLSSRLGSIPVVCEIKVGDDATPFYALVQTLAYAAELATPNQYKRLKATFPSAFGAIPNEPVLDICILMQDSPDDHQDILRETKAVVRGIYDRSTEFTSVISMTALCISRQFCVDLRPVASAFVGYPISMLVVLVDGCQ